MPELDTLRGIAVSMVVLFHAFGFSYGLNGLSGIPKLFVAATMPGWLGVNLFFVLSGFLITGILLDSESRPDYYSRFYLRRALRILPLYYAVLILLLLFVRTGMVSRTVSWAFLGLSAIYLSNITTLFGVPMQYGVLWSLAVEEHFYLFWPAVVRTFSRRRVLTGAFAVVMMSLLLRIAYCLFRWSSGPFTWLCADGLAFGAALAAVSRGKGDSRNSVRQFAILSFVACGVMFAVGAPFGIFLARHFLGVTFRETAIDIFFAGIVAGTLLLGTSKWRRFVNLRAFQFLGKISYGAYLIHMLIFEMVAHFTSRYWPSLLPSSGHFTLMLLQFCAAGSLTVGVASLSRRYFEEPFLKLKDRVRQANPTLSTPEFDRVGEVEMAAS